jgi:hypothetical protein
MRPSGFVDFAKAFDQSALIHGPDLIQDDLARLSFEPNLCTSRIGPPFRCHGSHNHCVDVMIHLVRGDDEAGTGFSNLTALGRIEPHEKHVEPGSYHVQSFRSHSEGVGASRSSN